MRTTKRRLQALGGALALALFPACQGLGLGAHRDLDELATWMTGTFSSEAQSLVNDSYFNVRLVMEPIWTWRNDGRWLYVEQAVSTALDKPYRQRVYHLVDAGDGNFESEVYEFTEGPEPWVGKYTDAGAFDAIGPDDLTLRTGCAIFLRRSEGGYTGSTRAAECLSSLRGATYATSAVSIEPGRVTSWDQGFDAEGVQVWGAEEGPYQFERIADAE